MCLWSKIGRLLDYLVRKMGIEANLDQIKVEKVDNLINDLGKESITPRD